MAILDSISLEFANPEANSDKLYTAELSEEDGTFVVRCSWGRRGAKQSSGEKYRGNDGSAAGAAYKKVVAEKTREGYTRA